MRRQWAAQSLRRVLQRVLIAAALALSAQAARAQVLLDDFSTAQAVGTEVAGPMVFGHRRLTSFPGNAMVSSGLFSYLDGSTAVLSYAPTAGEPGQTLDFSLVEDFRFSIGTAGTWPFAVLRLTSEGLGNYAQAQISAPPLAGGGSALVQVGLANLMQGQHGDFDLARVTALSLSFGNLAVGAGPATLDAVWATGTLPAVPELPVATLLAIGLLMLGALRRRAALASSACTAAAVPTT